MVVAYVAKMKEDTKIDRLISSIEACGDVILIGGAIRDIVFRGEIPRDFDLIVCCKDVDLQNCMRSSAAVRNSFGGYKIKIGDSFFDIWSIENHWPVKNGIISKEKERIAEGAFYDIDAIYVDLSDNTFVSEGFDKAMRTMHLDIQLDRGSMATQPHTFNIVRAYKLRKQWNLVFSEKVERYISEWASKTPQAMRLLTDEAIRHFGDASFLPRG